MLTKMISGDKNISEEREGNMAGNELLLVDAKDQEIGYGEKMEVHRKGVLHRAFSVFLLDADSGMLLLQKRNQEKYHSGGLWSNSCCSHQYQGETLLQAVNRCMKDELGIGTEQCSSVAEAGVFTYFSDYGEMKEHEIDHVFLCCTDTAGRNALCPNQTEAEDVRWIRPGDLDEQLKTHPELFTSWFAPAYGEIQKTEVCGK